MLKPHPTLTPQELTIMKVVWTLTPTRDGTRVEIVHDLAFRIPLLAWLAEPIIGGFFIENIASRTLAAFKQLLEPAESPVAGTPVVPGVPAA